MSTDTYTARPGIPVSQLGVDVRSAFITRTYTHLLGAILAFTMLEVYLFETGMAESIARVLLGGSWLIVLGGFINLSEMWRSSFINFNQLRIWLLDI